MQRVHTLVRGVPLCQSIDWVKIVSCLARGPDKIKTTRLRKVEGTTLRVVV